MKRICLGAIAAAAAMLSAPVAAQTDISARYEMSEDAPSPPRGLDMEITFEVSTEGHVRMQAQQMPMYFLYRDDTFYIVRRAEDGPVVVVASEYLNVQLEFAREMFGEDFGPDLEDLDMPSIDYVAIGEETVNGRTGTAYTMQDDDGEPLERVMLVLSNDPQLAPLGRAIQGASAGMSRGLGGPFAGLGSTLNEMNAIFSEGAPLRMMVLELTDVSFDDIPDERFELPAEPLTIEQMRAGFLPFDPPPTLPAPAE